MASGGFFSGLAGGIRFTDSLINGPGPLPTDLSGGPQGVYGEADGVYNGTSQLLQNVVPYSMPGQGNLNANRGPQTAHRVAAGIPCVQLPEPDPDAQSTFSLSHAVDNGDIAFIVTPMSSQKYVWLSQKPYPTQSRKHLNSLVHVNVFLNIVQVNYVLAGIFNRLLHMVETGIRKLENSNAWDSLICSFGTYTRDFAEHIVEICVNESQPGKKRKISDNQSVAMDKRVITVFLAKTSVLLHHIIKFHIRPFGICAGSEKQGGQHEGRDKPVQAAASYFTTLTVDGQNRDLVNIWRNNEIEGGDQLILHLAPVTRSSTVLYTLNHYNHGTVSKHMNFTFKSFSNIVHQLIPMFFKAGTEPENYTNEINMVQKICATAEGMDVNINIPKEIKEDMLQSFKNKFDYRIRGYWHCGQTHTKSARYGHVLAPFSDHEYLNGALMQVNWAPVWKGGDSTSLLLPLVAQHVIDIEKNDMSSFTPELLTSNSLHDILRDQLKNLMISAILKPQQLETLAWILDKLDKKRLPSANAHDNLPPMQVEDATETAAMLLPSKLDAADVAVPDSEAPKKKRGAVPKAARVPVALPTTSVEELELERLFAGQ